jgi:hypothetical protein
MMYPSVTMLSMETSVRPEDHKDRTKGFYRRLRPELSRTVNQGNEEVQSLQTGISRKLVKTGAYVFLAFVALL